VSPAKLQADEASSSVFFADHDVHLGAGAGVERRPRGLERTPDARLLKKIAPDET
jgi:hypothetical protein